MRLELAALTLLLAPTYCWRGALMGASPRHTVHRVAHAPRAMFSGIVEEMGTVQKLEKVGGMELWDGTVGEGWVLKVGASTVLEGAYLGCSISVNGVCLTATEFDDATCTFGLAPETLRCTNLASLSSGERVNLERAMAADGRNSGHMVQGHVDDVGEIIEMRPEDESLWFTVRPPPSLMPYIVPKGFIAIDGTSLTVCESNVEENYFTFMLVGYTQQKVILPSKKVGDRLNLEVDVTAKYVERSMGALLSRIDELESRLAKAPPPPPQA